MLKRLRNSFKRNSSRQAAHPPQSEDISLNDRGLVGKEEPLLSASGGSPGDDALYVREAAVIGIRNNSEQRSSIKGGMYLFHVQLTWSNGAVSHSCKGYRELFDFHCALLDMFPKEAGLVPESARSIPFLPGLGAPIHSWVDRGLPGTVEGGQSAAGRDAMTGRSTPLVCGCSVRGPVSRGLNGNTVQT